MAEQMTVADVRRMLRGERQQEGVPLGPPQAAVAIHGAPAEPTPAPQPAAAEPAPSLADLGLSDEQIDALRAHGYGDREAIRKASSDDLLSVPTVGRATVSSLRRQLEAD